MKWDAFTILEQILILLTIASQIWIAITVILKSEGAEQYVRIMSFSTGFLAFLITRALGVTFADMMLATHAADSPVALIVIGAVFPFLVGVLISEGTIIALRMGMPVPIRLVLMIAAFTLSQAAYTNYVALQSKVTTLDKAFVPNLSYAIAVGLWLTFRYRDKHAPKA
ncbi:hypothetical protein [Lysobacter brunescens]|uniref:Transmembrane protein n=1 Tax=Lysobacter brunescens TaxID=262323 RepID=A0ABW2YH76_9GAMM